MKQKHYFLFLSLALFGSAQVVLAQGDLPPIAEPGKCYAKCLMLDQYQSFEKHFPIYTGAPSDQLDLDTLYFKEKKDSRELILLGRLEDLNDEDLEELPTMEQVVCIPDTSASEDFIMETIFYLRLKRKGGFKEWREVLCAPDIGRVILPLQDALEAAGYLENPTRINVLNQEIRGALAKYQSDHNLPIGELDVETLEHLDIYFY